MPTFMEKLREIVKQTPPGDTKMLYKVILGDLQNLPGSGKSKAAEPTDEQGHAHVRKHIKGNEETIKLLRDRDTGDLRVKKLEEENLLLAELLPTYLTEDQIRSELAAVDVKSAGNDNMAMGVAAKHFKSKDLKVDGNLVKKVVLELRCSG